MSADRFPSVPDANDVLCRDLLHDFIRDHTSGAACSSSSSDLLNNNSCGGGDAGGANGLRQNYLRLSATVCETLRTSYFLSAVDALETSGVFGSGSDSRFLAYDYCRYIRLIPLSDFSTNAKLAAVNDYTRLTSFFFHVYFRPILCKITDFYLHARLMQRAGAHSSWGSKGAGDGGGPRDPFQKSDNDEQIMRMCRSNASSKAGSERACSQRAGDTVSAAGANHSKLVAYEAAVDRIISLIDLRSIPREYTDSAAFERERGKQSAGSDYFYFSSKRNQHSTNRRASSVSQGELAGDKEAYESFLDSAEQRMKTEIKEMLMLVIQRTLSDYLWRLLLKNVFYYYINSLVEHDIIRRYGLILRLKISEYYDGENIVFMIAENMRGGADGEEEGPSGGGGGGEAAEDARVMNLYETLTYDQVEQANETVRESTEGCYTDENSNIQLRRAFAAQEVLAALEERNPNYGRLSASGDTLSRGGAQAGSPTSASDTHEEASPVSYSSPSSPFMVPRTDTVLALLNAVDFFNRDAGGAAPSAEHPLVSAAARAQGSLDSNGRRPSYSRYVRTQTRQTINLLRSESQLFDLSASTNWRQQSQSQQQQQQQQRVGAHVVVSGYPGHPNAGAGPLPSVEKAPAALLHSRVGSYQYKDFEPDNATPTTTSTATASNNNSNNNNNNTSSSSGNVDGSLVSHPIERQMQRLSDLREQLQGDHEDVLLLLSLIVRDLFLYTLPRCAERVVREHQRGWDGVSPLYETSIPLHGDMFFEQDASKRPSHSHSHSGGTAAHDDRGREEAMGADTRPDPNSNTNNNHNHNAPLKSTTSHDATPHSSGGSRNATSNTVNTPRTSANNNNNSNNNNKNQSHASISGAGKEAGSHHHDSNSLSDKSEKERHRKPGKDGGKTEEGCQCVCS